MQYGALGTIWAEIGLNHSKLDTGAQQAEARLRAMESAMSQSLNNIGNSMISVGKKMTIGITTPLVLLGNQWLKTAIQFDRAMVNTKAVIGATAEEFDLLTRAARRAGEETIFRANQAAEALYYLAQSGMDAYQSIHALDGVLALAAATQANLSFTSEMIAISLRQFNLEADEAIRVANVYAQAVASSQANMEKLSYSLRYAGPVAAGFGHTIEETVGTLMALYNAGLQGSQAGITLRRTLQTLSNPTGEAKTVLAELGLTIEDVHPEIHSLAEIVATLTERGITSTQAMRLFGHHAGTGMMALLSQGSEALEEYTRKVTNTDKALEMARTQIDSLSGDVKLLESIYESLSITMVDNFEPVLRGIIQRLTAMLHWVNDLAPATQRLIVVLGGLAVAAGPVVALLGQIVKMFSLLSGPAGWIYLGVSSVIALGVALSGTSRDLAQFYENTLETSRATYAQANELRNLINEYRELEGKPDKSEQEHRRLERVMQDIIRLHPDIIKGYEDMGEAIENNITTLETYIRTLETQSELQLRMAYVDYLSTQVSLEAELVELQRQRAELASQEEMNLDELNRLVNLANDAKLAFMDYFEAMEELDRLQWKRVDLLDDEELLRLEQLPQELEVLRNTISSLLVEIWPDHVAKYATEYSPWGAWYLELDTYIDRELKDAAKRMAEIEKIDNRISEILETLERGASIEEELNRRRSGVAEETSETIVQAQENERKSYEYTISDIEEMIKSEVELYEARIRLVRHAGDEYAQVYGDLESLHREYIDFLSHSVYDKELEITEQFRAQLAVKLSEVKDSLEELRGGVKSTATVGTDPDSIVTSRIQVFNAELELLRKGISAYLEEFGSLEEHLTRYKSWLDDQLNDTTLSAVTHAQVANMRESVERELDILTKTTSEKWEELMAILSQYGSLEGMLLKAIYDGAIELDLDDLEEMASRIENYYTYLKESGQITLDQHLDVLKTKLESVVSGSAEWLQIWRQIHQVQKEIDDQDAYEGTNEKLQEQLELFEELKHENNELVNTYERQAQWLEKNVLNAEGVLRTAEEIRDIENEIFALRMAHFRELADTHDWDAQEQLANLDTYVTAYARSFDQIRAVASLQRQLNREIAAENERAKKEQISIRQEIADKTLEVIVAQLRNEKKFRAAEELESFAQLQRDLTRAGKQAELVELAYAAHKQRMRAIDQKYTEEEIKEARELGYRRMELEIQRLENEGKLYEADIQRSALQLKRELDLYEDNYEMRELAIDAHYIRLAEATKRHEEREKQRLLKEVRDEISALGDLRELDLESTKAWVEERARLLAGQGEYGIPAMEVLMDFSEALMLEEARRAEERQRREEQWTEFLIQSRQVLAQQVLREQVEALEAELALLEDGTDEKIELERKLARVRHELAVQTLNDQLALLDALALEEQILSPEERLDSMRDRLDILRRIREEYEKLYGENYKMSSEWQAVRRQELELEKEISREIAQANIREIEVNEESLESLRAKNEKLRQLIEDTEDYIKLLEYIEELEKNQEKIRNVKQETFQFFTKISPDLMDVISKTEEFFELIKEAPHAFANMRVSMIETFGDAGELMAGIFGGVAGYTGAGGGIAGFLAGITGAIAGFTANPIMSAISTGISFVSRLFDPGPVPQEMQALKDGIEAANKELEAFGVSYRAVEADLREKRFLIFRTGWEITNEEAAREGYEAALGMIESMQNALQGLGSALAVAIRDRRGWASFEQELGKIVTDMTFEAFMQATQMEAIAKQFIGELYEGIAGGLSQEELEDIRDRFKDWFKDLEDEWEKILPIIESVFPSDDRTVEHRVSGVQITRLAGHDREFFTELWRPIRGGVEQILEFLYSSRSYLVPDKDVMESYRLGAIGAIQAETILVENVNLYNTGGINIHTKSTSFEDLLREASLAVLRMARGRGEV